MTIEISELPVRMADLRSGITAGSEVLLTENGRVVGRFVPSVSDGQLSRVFDMHPGAFSPTPDFNDPLPDDFWLGGEP